MARTPCPRPWTTPPQAATSEATDVCQIPALHRWVLAQGHWHRGMRNLDLGGGACEHATELLREHGIKQLVWDPFNRSKSHNRGVRQRLKRNKPDTVTITNVLNVIAERSARIALIATATATVKKSGLVFVQIYEGDRSGRPRRTSRGHQQNRTTQSYVKEVENCGLRVQAVRRRGSAAGIIVAQRA